MKYSNSKIVQGAVFLLAVLLSACGGSAGDEANKTPAAAPTISTISPANNAAGVATNAAITATFSEAMDATTVSPTTFTLSNGVTGIVTYHERTATFTPSPSSPLTSGTTYTATITTGVKSVAGTAMASPFTWTFTTGTALDTNPPTVTSTSPDSGATNVTTNSAITATFSENMDVSTVIPANFTLVNGTSNVQGEVSYNGTTATFKPTNALANSTTYTATLSREVKDAAGNAMASARTWTFTTGAAADITAPTVSSTNPANSATGVATNASITATFSEPMTVSTVTTANFTLKNGTTSVQGTVDYSGTTATFKPNALAYSTTYTATISTGVKDLASNAMASDRIWSFTTAGTPIPTVTVVIDAPKTVTLTQDTTHLFKATVGGTTNTAVTWSATGGTIDNGLYTAPAMPGTYTVTATTQATPAASDTATVAVTVVATGAYITPGNVAGDVVVAMDSQATSPISPFIYGLNVAEVSGAGNPTTVWGPYVPKFTFNRHGGNNTTPLNWETGYTNSGFDSGYVNYSRSLDTAGYARGGNNGSMPPGPGNAVTPRIDFSHAHDAPQLVTVPIIGFVARNGSGVRQPIPAVLDATTPATLPPPGTLPSTGTLDPANWLQALPFNPACTNPACANASLNTTDDFVYTDDFVRYLNTKYLNAQNDPVKTIQYQLDNEPDLWFDTHPEIRGRFNGNGVLTGVDELVNKTAAHAKAVKSVAPNAVVWGGGFALFDAMNDITKNGAPPAGNYVYYFDYFLEKMMQESTAAKTRLMDVFDLHWYTQDAGRVIGNDKAPQDAQAINRREQAPRSLWDPYYIENSWIAGIMPAADSSNCNSGRCPIKLLPRMQARIKLFNPDTKIAIGEYWYGRGGDISAAITNADVLGIFGKYGVYAATMWPNATPIFPLTSAAYGSPNSCSSNDEDCVLKYTYQCALMAIDIYRNYDGNNAKFGDMSIGTSITDAAFTTPATQNERVTAYASMDANTPNRVVMVAINKADTALNAGLKITHTQKFSTAEVWQVTGTNGGAGGCTKPTRQPADITLPVTNGFNATLPAQSVTVFVLK